ncbi:hypothetical protein B0H21DRAFT_452111 [Amylocystis lapponica]|nr:hypothetical protein B0H21DRAFT_452111 [Amylocystis lapponica]
MLSFIAQRVALRAPTLNATNLSRARVVPILPLATRSQHHALSTSASLLAAAAQRKAAPAAKRATSAKKPATRAKKPAKKAVAAKKPAKRVAAKKKEPPTTLKSMKIAKEDRPPKGPPTPYLMFFTEFLKENGVKGEPGAAAASAAGAAWRALSDAEKQAYLEQARSLREKHKEVLVDYIKNTDERIVKALNVQRLVKGKTRVLGTYQGEPLRKQRAPRAFSRFIHEHYSEVDVPSDLIGAHKGRHIFVTLAQKWRGLSDTEKASYAKAHAS